MSPKARAVSMRMGRKSWLQEAFYRYNSKSDERLVMGVKARENNSQDLG